MFYLYTVFFYRDIDIFKNIWFVLKVFNLVDVVIEEDVAIVREICVVVLERGVKIVVVGK